MVKKSTEGKTEPRQPEEQPAEVETQKQVSHETKSKEVKPEEVKAEVSHETKDTFDADAYIKSIEPKQDEIDMQKLQDENTLLKKQNKALINAYNKQKTMGVTIVDNGNQIMKEDKEKTIDEMLRKYYE